MKISRFALAAVAAFAFNANAAQPSSVTGMGNGTSVLPPQGAYQKQSTITTDVVPNDQAFHAGGVAACDGCHVMHNAGDGIAKSTAIGTGSVAPWTNVTNMYLLQGGDQSSTCLICHGGSKQTGVQFQVGDTVADATGPSNFTPGGDFGWLKYDWTGSPAQRHGHNVAAVDFSMDIDTDLAIAPGGTWASGIGKAKFACSSCHDPHGRYRMQLGGTAPNGIKFTGPNDPAGLPIGASGSYGAMPKTDYAVGAYRLLGGQRYAPASNAAFPFPNDPPVAVAPQLYNSPESAAEVRVKYGTGMSEWCQNCHTNVHLDGYTSGVAGLRHPAGSDAFLRAGQIQVYNSYVSSGKVNAAMTDPYTSLVPFELGKDLDPGELALVTTIEATPTSNVMCLSCHRAHASAFDSMVRWDQNATFLTNGTTGDTGFTTGVTTNRNATLTQAGYYMRTVGAYDPAKPGTTLGVYQRSLCNKCHGKD